MMMINPFVSGTNLIFSSPANFGQLAGRLQFPADFSISITKSINIQNMSRQICSARLAVSMGSAALVVGMLYGTQVSNCPYPQLALGAHVQFMVAGMIGILAGLVLNCQSICQLDDSPTLLRVIDIAHYVLIVPSAAEGYAAFKGLGMPLVNPSDFME
jgi:hypothetical protein